MHNNSNFLYKPSNKNVPVIKKKNQKKKPISVLLNSSNCLALRNVYLLTSIYLYAKCRQCMLKKKNVHPSVSSMNTFCIRVPNIKFP